MRKILAFVSAVLLLSPFAASATVSDLVTVSGTTTKGAVGDTVSVKFGLVSKNFDCDALRVKLQATNTAQVNLSFTGAGSPSVSNVEEDSVSWTGKEIHTGDTMPFTAAAKITDGVVGGRLDDFVVLVGCGQHFWYEISEGTPVVEAIAKMTTATKTVAQKTTVKPAAKSLASISDLNSLFRSVYGRNPTLSEWRYWATRLLDKSDRTALVGAMGYHKANRIQH
jgi:hypothetical protein